MLINRIWVAGRISWLVVSAIVILCATIIVFDFVWRVVEVPFRTLLIGTAASYAVISSFALMGYLRMRRKGGQRKRWL
jgi:hypothetical protein